jgi:flagellar biosynthesis chaperone FliJ
MSNPLDGRIRALAREEAASMFSTLATATASDVNTDRVAELQQQITDLHEHLHMAATTIKHLGDRVDALEKEAAQASAEPTVEQPSAPRRTSRKAAG